MIIGVVTRNPEGWAPKRLREAIESLGHKPFMFRFSDAVAIVSNGGVEFEALGFKLSSLDSLIVRPIGRCSLDKAIFRIDMLYALEDSGVRVYNKPSAIEKAIDKFRALYTLAKNGVRVPLTLTTENPDEAVAKSRLLGKPVVVKPLFGSRGLGSTRVGDRDVLWRILHDLSYYRHVLYLQEYLRIRGRDIRAFVIGDRVIAAMYRVHPSSWKTNIAQGAKPVPFKPTGEIEELAIKAASILECEIAGVDIAEVNGEPYILEVNSQPGWRGLQSITKIDIAREIIKYIIETCRK